VPHFFKCCPFFQVWQIFAIAAHFSQCGAVFQFDAFFKVGHTFQGFFILPSVPHFFKCRTFFKVWHVFVSVAIVLSVVDFSKCGAFCKTLRILPKVAHFCKCRAFLYVWRIFPSLAHFFQCGAFFQVWSIF